MTENKENNKQKTTWKQNMEDFFHNYFIGISHLECSNENCPIVANWDYIEEKNSKKGLCALYKITEDNFSIVDAKIGNSNDTGTYENIELILPSGKKRKTELKADSKNKKTLTSGTNLKEKNDDHDLKDEEFVLFFNNKSHSPNLNGVDDYLEDIWEIKEHIKWDQDTSRKKIINWVEQKPDPTDKINKIDEWKKDYIFYVHNPDIANEIKKHEVFQTQNTKEREQLWADLKEEFSELRRVFGIRHLTSKKEERQNNPEIELNEAQFIALERRKKRIREQSIKEVENKKFCTGIHTLTYGTSPEQREEKVKELEEMKEIEEESENTEENKEE